jgi:hypothetical protein
VTNFVVTSLLHTLRDTATVLTVFNHLYFSDSFSSSVQPVFFIETFTLGFITDLQPTKVNKVSYFINVMFAFNYVNL